ncbi:MAG: family 10 glycosylhydrolase, partial [Muribaculaceae bacterium]|nr:family 10 glycosylhydrolase [Muribaculaceae bacterium]
VNAVFFQVRPQSDAFYPSEFEPWSRFLTTGGKAPVPFWDPLQFMIDEAHSRGMELHAWINPYRVTSSAKQTLPPNHIYHKHPERFIRYEGKLYFDPALKENRDFIVKIVTDIVGRYDIDGIHFDDYFYPYPGKTQFPDEKSFKRLGAGMNRDDWRRKNVDMLIKAVYSSVHDTKSWVRFGVSPFGIWRNKKNDSRGSATAGLENYDALYADVLMWAEQGWVDYLIPQLYWERGHRLADYDVLVEWWNGHVRNCHLYIGQDVNRSMDKPDLDGASDQLESKFYACRKASNIQGVCWWPAYSVTDNYKGVADRLRGSFCRYKALPPSYDSFSSDYPQIPESVSVSSGCLKWKVREESGDVNDAVRFVVYRFDSGTEVDLDDPSAIVAITDKHEINVSSAGTYVVTSLNRVNKESAPSKKICVR